MKSEKLREAEASPTGDDAAQAADRGGLIRRPAALEIEIARVLIEAAIAMGMGRRDVGRQGTGKGDLTGKREDG